MRLLAKEVSSYSKLLVFLTALSFILLINLGSSSQLLPTDFSCDDNQEILSISYTTNAHGQTYNSPLPIYNTEICFDKLFGGPGTGTRNTNNVLRLSSQTNAHGASNSYTSYNQQIKYDGLTCTVKTDYAVNCGTNELLLVALNSESNAHFSVVRSPKYPVAICCSAAGVTCPSKCGNGVKECNEQCDLGDPSLDPNGRNGVIGSGCSPTCTNTGDPGPGHLECIQGQCVEVPGAGTNLGGCTIENDPCGTTPTCGTSDTVCEASDSCTCSECTTASRCTDFQITSAVWKNSYGQQGTVLTTSDIGAIVYTVATFDNPLPADKTVQFKIEEDDLSSDDLIREVPSTMSSDRKTAYYAWQITNEDFEEGRACSTILGVTTCDENTLEFIFTATVVENPTKTRTSGQLEVDADGTPVVDQVPVAHITSPNEGDAYFTCNSILFDQDSIGTGLTYTWNIGGGITRTEETFSYTYGVGNAGQKDIRLEIRDNSQRTSRDNLSILVADNTPGVYAFINSPAQDSNADCRLIDYSGTGSYVIQVIGDPTTAGVQVTCLAGNCPAKMAGGDCINGAEVNIQQGNKGNYGNIVFNWMFDQGSIDEADKSSGKKVYRTYGNSEIKLKTKYTSGASTIESLLRTNSFTINRKMGTGSCSIDGRSFVDSAGNKYPTNEPNNCNRGGEGTSCCPQGYACANDGGAMNCIRSACVEFYDLMVDGEPQSQKIERCDQYNLIDEDDREEQCNLDCNQAFKTDVVTGLSKDAYINERCVWEGGACKLGYLRTDNLPASDFAALTCNGLTQLACVGNQCTTVPKREGLATCDENSDCANNPETEQHLACVNSECRIVNGPPGNNVLCSSNTDCNGGRTPVSCIQSTETASGCINGYVAATYTISGANCPPGSSAQIPCGQAIVELPFFGSLQFAISAIMVAMLYIVMFRRELMEKFLNR